jgi:transposase InsO family protein
MRLRSLLDIPLKLSGPCPNPLHCHRKWLTRRKSLHDAVHHGIEISMDGRGRCHDNIFVERLWWTVKHEWVYLRPAANGIEQKRSLAEFFDWYNLRRPHQALGWRTPNEAYLGQSTAATALAA